MLTPAGFAHKVSAGRWHCPPHLALLNRKLLDVAAGRCRRLLVMMPPRHGKSELVSKYFPAWFLGTYPDRRVILASYEADFAMTWGRKVRDLLQEHGRRTFGIGVRPDSTAANRWSIDGRLGGMDTAGVGGPMTGKGAHLLVIDDPVKNAEEANSTILREKCWDWYASTAYTRLEPGGSVVLIQTRWHEDDLAGRILQKAKDGTGEAFEVLNLPAFAEADDPLGRPPGAPLWPERYDTPALEGIRKTLGTYWFASLYAQRPVPAEGGCFKRSWFRYWSPDDPGFVRLHPPDADTRLARLDDCRRFGVVDLAFSQRREADYTVISAWAVTRRSDLVLLSLHRERLEGPQILPQCRAMMALFDLDYIAIEAQGAQLAIVQAAQQQGIPCRALKAETDKITRSLTAQVRTEAGQVYFPRHAAWLGEFESELLSFPKGTHDDMVDVVSYAALEVFRRGDAPESSGLGAVRERAERDLAEADYRDPDAEHWWE